jgi:hypothetical protein
LAEGRIIEIEEDIYQLIAQTDYINENLDSLE